jgi:hypothetical protein
LNERKAIGRDDVSVAELVLLKKLDEEDEGAIIKSVEFQGRQKRRNQIADQIKALSEPKANDMA